MRMRGGRGRGGRWGKRYDGPISQPIPIEQLYIYHALILICIHYDPSGFATGYRLTLSDLRPDYFVSHEISP